jgi:hypothetical protein
MILNLSLDPAYDYIAEPVSIECVLFIVVVALTVIFVIYLLGRRS